MSRENMSLVEMMDEALELLGAKRYEDAVNLYQRAANLGHAPAQYNLGVMYANGRVVKKDDVKAFECFKQAAQQGHPDAQYQLGRIYNDKQDYRNAFDWFKRAADQGNPDAQYNLGEMYYYGQGVNKNEAEAFNCFKNAADQDHQKAQYLVGRGYFLGIGTQKDEEGAIHYFEKGANKGDVNSQRSLGMIYYGIFSFVKLIKTNYSKAFKWLLKAAKQGDALAQYYLGRIYLDPLYSGVLNAEEYTKAFEWFEKAAEQGNTDALYFLGRLYEDGFGFEQDLEKGFELFQQAADKGHVNAKRKLEGWDKRDQEVRKVVNNAQQKQNEKGKNKMLEGNEDVPKDKQDEIITPHEVKNSFEKKKAKRKLTTYDWILSERDKAGSSSNQGNDPLAEVMKPGTTCSITHLVMVDPVMTQAGKTYEREAIEKHLENNDTDPLSNNHLENKVLIPNQSTIDTRNAWFNQTPVHWHNPELIYLPKAWQTAMVEEGLKQSNREVMSRYFARHPGLLTLSYDAYKGETLLQLFCRHGNLNDLDWLMQEWEKCQKGCTQHLLEKEYLLDNVAVSLYTWGIAHGISMETLTTLFNKDENKQPEDNNLLDYAVRNDKALLMHMWKLLENQQQPQHMKPSDDASEASTSTVSSEKPSKRPSSPAPTKFFAKSPARDEEKGEGKADVKPTDEKVQDEPKKEDKPSNGGKG